MRVLLPSDIRIKPANNSICVKGAFIGEKYAVLVSRSFYQFMMHMFYVGGLTRVALREKLLQKTYLVWKHTQVFMTKLCMVESRIFYSALLSLKHFHRISEYHH